MDNDGFYLDAQTQRIVRILFGAVIVFCIYLVVSAIITAQNTGVLKVSASSKGIISVSRTDTQARIIGVPGSARVRLKPGNYQVIATTSDGKQTGKIVSIEKKRSTEVTLKPVATPKLHSLDGVTFFGTASLTDRGITAGQMDILRLDLFRFDTSATSVRIDAQSVRTAPHSLGNPFVLTFSVIIGSRTYNARTSYSDPTNIQLQLYNPQNGHQVYDSYAAANVKNLD